MDNIKELCKRVLASNLSDDDKIEIISKLNKTDSIIINQQPYRIEPIPLSPYYTYTPNIVPNHTEITCKS